MKVGYFTHFNIKVSETFIYDLMVGLDKKTELIWFSGQPSINKKILKKQIATSYLSYGAVLPLLVLKVFQIKKRLGDKLKNKTRMMLSNYALNKIHKRDFPDIAYIEYLTSAVLLRSFLERNNIPYIVHVHGFDISSALIEPEYKKELQKVFFSVNEVITASDYIKRLLIIEGCPPEKITVIRLGIDGDSIKPLSWECRLKEPPSVIFLGRLTEKKNPIALILAFDIVRKIIPNVKFTIIGDGLLRRDVESRIKSLGLENYVSLLGALPREKSFPIMNKHWIYAQHSVTAISGDKEGYAISPAEAAAHELPVVSTIHNGIPEHVIDGETGFLVPEFDYESMAERIIQLIQNPMLAKKMGRAGRNNILALNNPQKRIDKIYNLLEKHYRLK